MPENAKINTLSTIADIVLTATGATQQQYISSQLDADKRKEKAEKYIENGFKIVNFKETPEVKEWVDAVIDKTIYDNKTDAEKKGQEQNTLQKQVAQLQQEKSELQSQLNQKQQEVTSLTQKITTIQSTVKSEQPQQPADPTK
jgi:phage shock protein A